MSYSSAISQSDNAPYDTGWQASLNLTYNRTQDKTVLTRQDHQGPLIVQKPFYPEGLTVCHTYIVHPPGGVVAGDTLSLAVVLGHDAHTVITTPSAGKFYRSAGKQAALTNKINVADGAVMEWLPQETIVFDQADVQMTTQVDLTGDAAFIGWEMICLGLPVCAQPFSRGRLIQHFKINRDHVPIFIESLRIKPGDPLLAAPWGLAGQPVIGTMVATIAPKEALMKIQERSAGRQGGGYFTVTSLPQLIVCRYIGKDVYAGFKFFRMAWEIVRPLLTGKAPCPPRIWAT